MENKWKNIRDGLIFASLGLAIAIPIKIYNFLLFHTLIEFLCILVALFIFIIIWNQRKNVKDNYLFIIGTGFLWVAVIDFLHTMTYKGMNIFPEHSSNHATQLWIASRYFFVFFFLSANYNLHKPPKTLSLKRYFIIGGITTTTLLVLIFTHNFPDCFIEGVGLTPFKIWSEYIIIFLFLIASYLQYLKRDKLDNRMYHLIQLSYLFSIISEISFTFYNDVYAWWNFVGHIFKLLSYFYLYKGYVSLFLTQPQTTLYRNLYQAKNKLEELNKRLSREVSEAKKIKKSKSMSIATMAHDLRAPLNAIIGYTEVLQDELIGSINPEQRDFIDTINKAGHHLLDLANHIIEFSKLEMAKEPLKKEYISLTSIIIPVKSILSKKIEDKNISYYFESALEDGQDDIVYADPLKIREVMFNLLDNAIKYTPKNGAIGVKLVESNDFLHFVVWDTGIGISPEESDKLFQPFSRIKNEKTKNINGIGLGLNYTKKIIELHGGKIWVDSIKGGGSQFHVKLPKHPLKEDESASNP